MIKKLYKIFNITIILLLVMGMFAFNGGERVHAAEGDVVSNGVINTPNNNNYDPVPWTIIEMPNGDYELQLGREGQTYNTCWDRTITFPWVSGSASAPYSKIKSMKVLGKIYIQGLKNQEWTYYGAPISETMIDADLSGLYFTAHPLNTKGGMSFARGNNLQTLDIRNFDCRRNNDYELLSVPSVPKIILGEHTRISYNSFGGQWKYVEDLNGNAISNGIILNSLSEYDGTYPGTYVQTALSAVLKDDTLYIGNQDTSEGQLIRLYNNNVLDESSANGAFYQYANQIKYIEFLHPISTTSSTRRLFKSLNLLQEIRNIEYLDTSNITDFSQFFYAPYINSSLLSVNLSNFNTNNATTFKEMFYGTININSIDISNFTIDNTDDVTDMFRHTSAKEINAAPLVVTDDRSSLRIFSENNNLNKITLTFSEDYSKANSGNIFTYGTPEEVGNTNFTKIFDENGSKVNSVSSILKNINTSGTWIRSSLLEPTLKPDNTYEWVSIDELWVDNGDNTWSYTFDVFDDNLPYWYWEEDMNGYDSDIPLLPGYKTTINKQGQITNTSNEFGSLEISKNASFIPNSKETDRSFDFIITLEGNGLEGTKVFSDVVFTNGVGKIKLKDGENKVISGLPDGITYSVEETPLINFATTSEGENGTIESGETQVATFANTEKFLRDIHPVGDVTLAKEVNGTFDQGGEYSIYASFSGLDANMTYSMSNGDTFTSDALGNATFSLTIAPEEEITFIDLPVNSTYQFSEVAGDYISAYHITDANDLGLIANSANQNTQTNIELSTGVETLDNGEAVTVTFSNTLIKKQNIKVKKTVIGTPEDKSKTYDFEIYFYNLEPNSYFNSDIGRIVADDMGEAMKGFMLSDGQEVVFEEIPVGAQYMVKELKNASYASYIITDENGGTNIVKSSDANSSVQTALSTDVETINENEEALVNFTNTSEITIKLKKEVDGNMGNKNDKFTFYVTIDGVEQTVEIGHNEEKEYKIKYSTPWSIREENYSQDGYRTYINSGALQSRSASGNGNENKDITFRNIKGAAIPTEVRFYWWSGILLFIIPAIFFVLKKKKELKHRG